MERYQEPVITKEEHEIIHHYEPYTPNEEKAIVLRFGTDEELAAEFGRTIKAINIKRYFLLNPDARQGVTGGKVIKASSASFVKPLKAKAGFISEADLQAEMEAGEQ